MYLASFFKMEKKNCAFFPKKNFWFLFGKMDHVTEVGQGLARLWVNDVLVAAHENVVNTCAEFYVHGVPWDSVVRVTKTDPVDQVAWYAEVPWRRHRRTGHSSRQCP